MPLMPLLGTWSPGGCCDPRPRADPSSLLSPRPLFVQMLSERLIPFVALDVSASRVQDGKRLDLPVYFGDAGSPAVLHAVGADKAACAVRRRDVPARLPTRPPTYLLDTPPSPPRQCTPHPPTPPPSTPHPHHCLPTPQAGHHAGHCGRQLPQRLGHAQAFPARQDLCARV